MPILRPFHGVRYDQRVVPLEEVVAPPYDVISREQQQRLYDRHPNNVVRLILGREEDRYASAANHLSAWRADGVLKNDDEPSIYVLHQTFDGPNGNPVTRKGFIALCHIEEFDKKIVLPHERTLSKAREDRFKLFTSTRSNFSQIFSLYWDAEHAVDEMLNGSTKGDPVCDVSFEMVQNRLWRVGDRKIIDRVSAFMKDEQVLIADGHHRYETALAYRDARRKANPHHTGEELYNYVMMFFSNIEDDGLVIYPTHRVVHSLQDFDGKRFLASLEKVFVIREVANLKALRTGLDASSSRSFGILVTGDPRMYMASLRPTLTASECVTDDLPEVVKELDVTLLHAVILRDLLGISAKAQELKTNLDYVKHIEDAVNATREGSAQISFIMNATRLEEVRAVAKAGLLMPQKSTYFFPKLVSGLVMNIMD